VAVAVWIFERSPGHYRLCAHTKGLKRRYRYMTGSRSDAERAAAAWQHEIETFGVPPGHPSQPLGDYIKNYLSRQTHLSLRTRDWYEDFLLRRMIDPADVDTPRAAFISGVEPNFRIGRRPIGQISPADGINWLRWMQDAHDGRHRSIYAAFHLARTALADAASLRIIPSNPWEKLRHKKLVARRVAVPTRGELRKIGVVAAGDPRLQLLLDLALATGGRRGELLALQWRHIDLETARLSIHAALQERGGEITVKAPKTTAGARTISLPPHIIPTLRHARAAAAAIALANRFSLDDLPVFPARDDPQAWWSPAAASQAARRALHAGDVPVSLHALRHAHATALLSNRVNPAAVQHRMGHSSAAVTLGIYAHVVPEDDDAAAAAAISRAIGKIA